MRPLHSQFSPLCYFPPFPYQFNPSLTPHRRPMPSSLHPLQKLSSSCPPPLLLCTHAFSTTLNAYTLGRASRNRLPLSLSDAPLRVSTEKRRNTTSPVRNLRVVPQGVQPWGSIIPGPARANSGYVSAVPVISHAPLQVTQPCPRIRTHQGTSVWSRRRPPPRSLARSDNPLH